MQSNIFIIGQTGIEELAPVSGPTLWDAFLRNYRDFELPSLLLATLLILVFFTLALRAKEPKSHLLHAQLMTVALGIHWALNLSYALFDISSYCNAWKLKGIGKIPTIPEVVGDACFKLSFSLNVTVAFLILFGILRFKRRSYEKA